MPSCTDRRRGRARQRGIASIEMLLLAALMYSLAIAATTLWRIRTADVLNRQTAHYRVFAAASNSTWDKFAADWAGSLLSDKLNSLVEGALTNAVNSILTGAANRLLGSVGASLPDDTTFIDALPEGLLPSIDLTLPGGSLTGNAGGPPPPEYDLGRVHEALQIHDLPNRNVTGRSTWTVSGSTGVFEPLGPYQLKAELWAASPPWTWQTWPITYLQSRPDTDQVHAWFEEAIEAMTGDVKEPLRLADDDE